VISTARAADEIKITQADNHLDVTIGGKPFTTYWFGPRDDRPYVRPFFYPVLAVGQVPITSDQYAYKKEHPKADHPHHISLWVGQGDVNGADQWAYAKKEEDSPKQRNLGIKIEGDGFVQNLEWEGKDHKPILKEVRTVRFLDLGNGARGIDFTSAFTPIDSKVTFGDTKESGLVAVRMCHDISDHNPQLTNATGETGEKTIWGKPANWADESGFIDGKPYGVAILDSPQNPRHPARWHIRDYGLMSSNIFGLHDFDRKNPAHAGDFTIEPGKTVTWKHRVVIHPGLAKDAKLDEQYNAFAK
jgi:hypothetical protein